MESEFSIKLRLEKLSRSQLFVWSCLFILVFTISTILSSFIAPSIMSDISVSVFKCSATNHRDCYSTTEVHEVWQAIIPKTSRLSQFLYMSVTPRSKKSIDFNLTMEIEVLHDNQILQKRTKHKHVYCHKGTCDSIQIFYIPYVEYKSYTVTIKHKSPILSDSVKIDLLHVSEEFSKYQIIIKYTYFTISVFSFIQYLLLSLKIPHHLWGFESKILLPLGVSLVIFNEPLLLATIYYMSPLWSAVSVFSNSQFLAILLFFWFFQLHHFRDSKFNKVFIIIETLAIATLFCLSFYVYLYLHQELRNNPAYDWQNDLSERYKEVFIGIITICSILLAWIVALAVSAAAQIRKLSYRERIIKVLSLVMLGFTFCGVFIGAFQPLPRNSSFFLVYLSGFNLYVISLQFLYSPTRQSLLEYETEKNIEYSLIKSHEEDFIEMT